MNLFRSRSGLHGHILRKSLYHGCLLADGLSDDLL